jgi:Pyridine nucleotide-disulphide oxidoreductase
MEAQLCVNDEVVVVGGGNAAGQAAVFLAQAARRVHILIRRDGLADTMSRYLIRRIEENPRIILRTCTQIIALEGNGRLERIRWRDDRTGDVESHDIGHLFVMIGAVPNTEWLAGCVVLDEKGFVKTGPTCLARSLMRRGGRSRGPPFCSRPADRASSLWVTCAPATSSVSRRRSAKARSPLHSCTKCCRGHDDVQWRVCPHRCCRDDQTARPICVRRLYRDTRPVGSPPDMSSVRTNVVLR